MGLEVVVPRPNAPSLGRLLEELSATGLPSLVAMVDGALQVPGAVPPVDGWRDVRLRTPAGTVTLLRRPDGVAVVIFGNADDALQGAQRRIVEILARI